MALKLISTLSILILSCFIFKVWEKTKVPSDFQRTDAWKVRTIEFGCRFIDKWSATLDFLGFDRSFSRSLHSGVANLMHGTVWPFSDLYKHPNDSSVSIYQDVMYGVNVLIYENVKVQPDRVALIYFHSGGWTSLRPDDAHNTLLALSRDLGFLCISVDYRLAPEHHFPAGLTDCLSVTKYVLNNYQKVGVNRRKVIVAGDGAGANLAAAVSLELRSQLRMQILINPILQAFDLHTPSYRENKHKFKYTLQPRTVATNVLRYAGLELKYREAILLNKHLSHPIRMSRYRKYVHSDLIPPYLNITNLTTLQFLHGDDQVSYRLSGRILDPLFMPLMSERLSWVPNAYIITSQHDVTRDDGIMYANRLLNVSVKVKLEHYADSFHGFFHYSRGPLTLHAATKGLARLKSFLDKHVVQQYFKD